MIDLPIWVELLIAVMALDFTAQYFVHYLLHKVPFMWRFHMVHHSDTTVDATSATRHHPGDYLMREVFALLVIIIFGIPFTYYIFYRMLTVFLHQIVLQIQIQNLLRLQTFLDIFCMLNHSWCCHNLLWKDK